MPGNSNVKNVKKCGKIQNPQITFFVLQILFLILGIIVMGGQDGFHPSKVKLFKNRPHMTFDDAQAKCDQEFELVQDHEGTLEYTTKVVTFSSVHHLSLHFPSNFGEDVTEIYYIGFKGEFTPGHRTGVVNAVYEARPMLEDHKQDLKKENFAHF